MASNLRDRGYPSANGYRPDYSDKKNLLMTNEKATVPFHAVQNEGGATRENPILNKLMSAYNRKAIVNPNMPLVSKVHDDYVTDDTDERAFLGGLDLRNHNNDRLAFAHANITPTSSGYYAGIDRLPFGANEYSKSVNTPWGTFGAGYDGDGTASISYESSPNVYYLKALANLLLNRGTI